MCDQEMSGKLSHDCKGVAAVGNAGYNVTTTKLHSLLQFQKIDLTCVAQMFEYEVEDIKIKGLGA